MEFVYVVKKDDLWNEMFHWFNGFAADCQFEPDGFFVERTHAEADESMKQIIPYCVLLHGEHIFVTQRLSKGGEARLHGKLSIGIGGHINPVDVGEDRSKLIENAVYREVDEECTVHFWQGSKPIHIGFLNDDSNSVGRVHFGVVFVYNVIDAIIKETDQLTGEWVNVDILREDARNHPNRYENWSLLVIENLKECVRFS